MGGGTLGTLGTLGYAGSVVALAVAHTLAHLLACMVHVPCRFSIDDPWHGTCSFFLASLSPMALPSLPARHRAVVRCLAGA
jgi:predicted HD phosphohydrolase